MKIHKEGKQILLLAGIGDFFMVVLAWTLLAMPIAIIITIVSSATFLFLLQFFRNPERPISKLDDSKVYAPADGKIVVIEKTFEPEYLKCDCMQISIFMSPLNVHVNRNPISGKVLYAKHHSGSFLPAWNPKSSTENERTTTVLQNGNTSILFRQIAGALAKRICYYLKENQTVQQGEEMGFIKFGSRVDLFLPVDATINVSLNQMVKGNIDVLATLGVSKS